MAKSILEEDAIKTTWMILNGLGYYEGDNVSLVNDVRAVFDTAPAADAVEVVRCKDCVHRPEAPNGATSGLDVEAPRDEEGWSDETCPYLCEDHWYNTIPQDEWFCHHGERKKNA